MKIKHFIVTYNNNEVLNQSLQSIFDGIDEAQKNMLEVFVINNHTNFFIEDRFVNQVKVLHNQTRADFSTGHLSRDWNAAIISGFVSLKKPKCDILVTSQNDTQFRPNYINTLIDIHAKKHFTSRYPDDICMSYTPYAVKRVGLWDERFCNIGYQEQDYFMRVKKFLQPEEYEFFLCDDHPYVINSPTGHNRSDVHHLKSMQYHGHSYLILNKKWSNGEINLDSHIYYPYFEFDVETLKEQRYII